MERSIRMPWRVDLAIDTASSPGEVTARER